jgi:formylglycine-generating enzyme required for sulfatase activity
MAFEGLQKFVEQYVPAGAARDAFDEVVRQLAGDSRAASVLATLPDVTPVTLGPEPGGVAVAMPALAGFERYRDLGPLGEGGMGEVRRVFDTDLQRVVAMKILKLRGSDEALVRFLSEAQLTAQLQHPGIVPVYELGRTVDERLYFTMKEVRGTTMQAVIDARWRGLGDEVPADFTLRPLIDGLHKVCEAVAYAHARGVVHRDLKPSNVMIGEFGEMLVLDWGISRIAGASDAWRSGERPATARELSGLETVIGTITGTPTYMPPEQALGDLDRIGPPADVYALGAMLYAILTGRPPYQRSGTKGVLGQLLAGPPPPVHEARPHPRAPDELVEICARAMGREPEDRYSDAGELAKALAGWLDGSRRRERAIELVDEALALSAEADALAGQARAAKAAAAAFFARVKTWEPEERKHDGWALEDRARALERAANARDAEAEQRLGVALSHDPELAAAHRVLAARARHAHAEAESARRPDDASRAELALRRHSAALPVGDPDRVAHERWLRGTGTVQLVTDVPATVVVERYTPRGRRWIPEDTGLRWWTPVLEELPIGSYRLILRAPGRADVRYPVEVVREGTWDGIAPGDAVPTPIVLPPPLPDTDCYVPAGWTRVGGDPVATLAFPAVRVWLDAFVVRKFAVTNGDYLAFVNDLVDTGRADEADEHQPRERSGGGGPGAPAFVRGSDARYALGVDPEGDAWDADAPICLVSWLDARAYAAWLAAREGVPWRLIGDLEWEKAARGVDGRTYPWGDAIDASFARLADSQEDHLTPASVRDYPVDESVYGVRGLAGNMRCWCADDFDKSWAPTDGERAPERPITLGTSVYHVIRGGQFRFSNNAARSAQRQAFDASFRSDAIGIRLARTPRV